MVIRIEVKEKALSKFLRSIPTRLRTAEGMIVKRLANDARAWAIEKAPFKTGDLVAGITTTISNRRQAKVLSTVPDHFPYNLWVNQSPGFEMLSPSQIVKPFFMPGQDPFRYGDSGVKSGSGKGIHWSGTPKFFDIAFELMLAEAPSVYDGKVRDALRAK